MIIGLMAIHNFPLAPLMLHNLSMYCDKVIMRFDTFLGDKKTLRRCVELVPKSKLCVIYSERKWNRYNWREQLVQEAGKYKPNLVLFPDSDEVFHPEVMFDFQRFVEDDKANLLMFKTEMVSDDGREVKLYPRMSHCKAFKYQKGINYEPYQMYAIPNVKDPVKMKAQTKIQHWCFYTRFMEKNKKLHK